MSSNPERPWTPCGEASRRTAMHKPRKVANPSALGGRVTGTSARASEAAHGGVKSDRGFHCALETDADFAADC
eukprot:scaffold664_cov260-Pinguiococcus_pyrenoidosus.AAC.4